MRLLLKLGAGVVVRFVGLLAEHFAQWLFHEVSEGEGDADSLAGLWQFCQWFLRMRQLCGRSRRQLDEYGEEYEPAFFGARWYASIVAAHAVRVRLDWEAQRCEICERGGSQAPLVATQPVSGAAAGGGSACHCRANRLMPSFSQRVTSASTFSRVNCARFARSDSSTLTITLRR